MTDDLSQLPGAPPPGDPGHQPATSPGGLVQDTGPAFQPRPVDVSQLTPQQRHAHRQAISVGTREAYEQFLASLNGQQNTAGSPAEVAPPAGEPAVAEPMSAEAQAIAEALVAHGSDPEALGALETPMAAVDRRLVGMSEQDMVDYFRAGEQEVTDRLFAGNGARHDQALREIGDAARALGGDGLVTKILESGYLTDIALFQRLHLLARQVNSGRKAE